MTHEEHISDANLRLIVAEDSTTTDHSAEAHIAGCASCQSRLLAISAGDELRHDIASNCNELSTELLPDDHAISSDVTTSQTPTGDAFDLHTVDEMLKEVLEPSIHLETLGRLGRYEVESVLGCGGMGVVLRGFDHELHRPVAIKMILPRHSRNQVAKQRFAREARSAATVLHPNVIGIHDISETADVPWFVMPLVVGPNLKQLVDEHGPLPEREIIRIARQIASGLAAAHSQGVVHRDIKPENILVDNRVNRIVITDFGLARQTQDHSVTQTGVMAGTINYMSPEQSLGQDLDHRSDLFSLGSVMYFLTTGSSPFQSSSPMRVLHAVGGEPHKPVQSLNREVSVTFASLVDRLLAKDRKNRMQSATELEAYLNEYLAHLNQPQTTELPGSLAVPRLPARSRVVITVVGIALAAVAGFWISGGLGSPPENSDGARSASGPAKAPAQPDESPSSNFSMSSPFTWEGIKQKHQLEEPSVFNSKLQALQHDCDCVEATSCPDVLSHYDDEMLRLEIDAQFLDESIEDLR